MSFIKNLTSPFRRNQDVYSQSEAHLWKQRADALMDHIVKDTPRPTVPRVNITEESDIRLPPYPYSMHHLYELSYSSPVLSLSQIKIKQEIFRETRRIGFDFEEKFKFRCEECDTEMEEIVDQCDYCDSTSLVKADPRQKLIWKKLLIKANSANQTLYDVLEELEDDLNIADDAYLILVKDYVLIEGQVFGKIRELMRGDPVRMRIVSDLTGRRGGKLWTCPEHRGVIASVEGVCHECGFILREIHYVETLTGGKDPIAVFIEGEVIHSSKYRQSRLYGISPVFTLWVLSYTMVLMDHYIKNLYQKGRSKGIIAIPGHYENIRKWWDSEQSKLQQDPHYLPFIAVEPTVEGKVPGKLEFVKLLDSLSDLQANDAKELMRRQISSLYGVSPIFQADMSAGTGLNNEGLQITVTDRAVDYGQSVYHTKFFPLLLEMLDITDWIIRFQPSREMDEMADLQKRGQEIDNAQKLVSMGFEIEIKNDEFIVTSTKPVPQQTGFQQPGGMQQNFPRLPAGQPDQQQPGQPEPDNSQGMKNCPPGQHAHPDRVKCHPMETIHAEEKSTGAFNALSVKCRGSTFQQELREASDPNHELFWTLDKVEIHGDPDKAENLWFIADKEVKGFFPILGYGMRNYRGKEQQVVFFDRQFTQSKDFDVSSTLGKMIPMEKSGDMLAHYSCLATKMEKAAISCPKDLKIGSEFREWVTKQEPVIREKIKEFEATCLRAGSNKNPRDPDYHYPYPEKSLDYIATGKEMIEKKLLERRKKYSARFFDMIRENDESGVSGTGHVASGIIFQDGKVTIRWLSEKASTVNFDSFDDFMAIHIDSHPSNNTKLVFHDLLPGDAEKMLEESVKRAVGEGIKNARKVLKQVENKRVLTGKVEEVEEDFVTRLTRNYLDVLTDRLEFLPDTTPELIAREIDSIVITMQQLAEQMAFGEVLLGYDAGKRTAGENPEFQGLLKSVQKERAPEHLDFDNLPYSHSDIQALRAIYQESPFWGSFESMSQSISDKLKQIIKESFEAPNSARFQSEFEQVQVEYPDRTVPAQQAIVFGRLGKFSLPQVIDQMKQVVSSEVYRLERIARTETHAVTLKGREIALNERDPDNEFLYDWIGPADQRTTEICTEAKKRVSNAGGSVSLPALDKILKDVTAELNPEWTYRSWTPHANCRHLFRKVA